MKKIFICVKTYQSFDNPSIVMEAKPFTDKEEAVAYIRKIADGYLEDEDESEDWEEFDNSEMNDSAMRIVPPLKTISLRNYAIKEYVELTIWEQEI